MVEDQKARTLVVLLHAYTHKAKNLEAVATEVEPLLLRRFHRKAKVLRPELPASLASMADPDEIVQSVLDLIDNEWHEYKSRDEGGLDIVLVGHSLGALIARKAYVVACGEYEEAPLEDVYKRTQSEALKKRLEARPWARSVSRIILFAGMNRGWRVSHHLNLWRAPLWWLGSGICNLVRFVTGRWPLIARIRRGAKFITQLRIQWIWMRKKANSEGLPGKALTIQLLGSRDDMVAPEDNIDLVSGEDFIYLDVPYSGHEDVIYLNKSIHRRNKFEQALCDTPNQLEKAAIIPSDERFGASDPNIKHVVFVIHGIRDPGYWTHKIARRVKERAPEGSTKWATETSGYGYFPMLPFLFPWYRSQKVEWLMDQYTEALAKFPDARFSYVGHSNGTFLVAEALKRYPSCRFDHIVFAGSVVQRKYDWTPFIDASPSGSRPC